MKKWLKWTLGIIGVIVVGLIIFIALNWNAFSILSGTEELSGTKETIPGATPLEQDSLVKGESDWISWLGAQGDNRSQTQGIIKDWSSGLKKIWEVNFLCQGRMSATWSAPVIQGNRLVVCGRNTDNDLIFCLDSRSGKLLWQASYSTEATTNHGAGPRATPYIDEDRVYTFGRSGYLACWNLLDGQEIWRKNVTDEGGKEPTWGHSSSPLVLEEQVIVQAGGSAGTIAYQKMTGEVSWKSGNGIAGYTAITTMEIAGKSVLLVFHGKGLAALNPKTGTKVWNVPWETSYDVNATTPVTIGDKVFITSGYGTGCELLKVDSTQAKVVWKKRELCFTPFRSLHYRRFYLRLFWR